MDNGISPAEWRYIELKGYMSSVSDLPRFGIKKGFRCMNCYSMVYYDKCPNDECYNFYFYTWYKNTNDKMMWDRLDELGITKEK